MKRRSYHLIVGSLAALAAVLLPATAFAADPSPGPGSGQAAQEQVASGVLSSGGGLPFTGLNVSLIVVGGLILLAAGILLRRWSSKASSN